MDFVIERSRGQAWSWSASRPHSISDPDLGITRIVKPHWDIMSDTLKLRRSGFQEAIDTEQMFLDLFAHFRRQHVIP